MRSRSARLQALIFAAGAGAFACGSAALGQQFTISDHDIYAGSGEYVSNYNGPSNAYDIRGYVVDGGHDAFNQWMYYQEIGLGGLTLNRRVDSLFTINTYRHIDTFTNNTGSYQQVAMTLHGNFGAGRYEAFAQNDAFGFVCYDPYVVNSFDFGSPVIGFMNGNNSWGPFGLQYTPEHVDIFFGLQLAPGESISLMFATFLSRSVFSRSGDVALAQNTVNAMLADPMSSGLYQGLTEAEINSIANWTVPTPGAAAALGLGGLAAFGARRRRL